MSIAYATQIITMAGSMGLDMPILGGDTLDSNMVIAAAEGTDLEIYVSTFYQEGADEEFDSGFKTWMNEDSARLTNNGGNDTIAAVSVMGFDGYNTAIAAILAADSVEPGDIKAALGADGFSYTGVTGEIVFDETGDAVRDTAYIKMVDIANQSWTLAAVQTVE